MYYVCQTLLKHVFTFCLVLKGNKNGKKRETKV